MICGDIRKNSLMFLFTVSLLATNAFAIQDCKYGLNPALISSDEFENLSPGTALFVNLKKMLNDHLNWGVFDHHLNAHIYEAGVIRLKLISVNKEKRTFTVLAVDAGRIKSQDEFEIPMNVMTDVLYRNAKF
jgi:hypothetical protein